MPLKVFFLYLYKKKVMKDTDTPPVQHIGEFVLTKNGNLDFGEIPSEIAKVIRKQEGKIRLRIGVEIDNEIGKKPLLWKCQSERA